MFSLGKEFTGNSKNRSRNSSFIREYVLCNQAILKIKMGKINVLIISIFGLFICSAATAQTLDDHHGKDVKSIEAIVDAYYEVISGSSKDPWQFERDTPSLPPRFYQKVRLFAAHSQYAAANPAANSCETPCLQKILRRR